MSKRAGTDNMINKHKGIDREARLSSAGQIGPIDAPTAGTKRAPLPTLAARNAQDKRDGIKGPTQLAGQRQRRPGKGEQFVKEDGHVLEPERHYLGKRSKITRAIPPDDLRGYVEQKDPKPTLAARFSKEGMAAYGLSAKSGQAANGSKPAKPTRG